MKLTFGPHQGQALPAVPDAYLLELATRALTDELRLAVDAERERRWRPVMRRFEKKQLTRRREPSIDELKPVDVSWLR